MYIVNVYFTDIHFERHRKRNTEASIIHCTYTCRQINIGANVQNGVTRK